MSAPRFITLEGIEGAGKSTATRFVCDWLTARGVPTLRTREPGGTPLAERVREIVLQPGAEHITPQTETLLMFAARGAHVENLVRPALARGEWVVSDRFTDATRAYQGAGRGVSRELIETLARAVHGDLWPHLTLLLDLPVAAGMARVRERGAAADRFEQEQAAFFERVRAEYLAIAAREPQRMQLIDASAAVAGVQAQIAAVLARLL
ncbi:MAG TPA: dTMP kinase [Steroidobacteraceae bacterium]|nr:dTMP kinase [Steroidobacteraceae bacterium]